MSTTAGAAVAPGTDPYATRDRQALRESVRAFVEREVCPDLDRWERDGELPRTLHRAAAEVGLLGLSFPERVGGGGGNLLDEVVVTEEVLAAGGSGGVVAGLLTSGIALPHLVQAGTPEQVDRWVRPVLAGEAIAALAVTEPDGGSDVASLRTTARRDGDHYVLDGAKTFITSGARADFVTVAVRTGVGPRSPAQRRPGEPARATSGGERERDGARGISLLVVERGTPGFAVTRRLDTMGWHCSDTAELSFTGCRVPVANLVGAEGSGFSLLAAHFASERIMLAVQAYATAQRCLDLTVQWARDRRTFGRPLLSRQVVAHRLVDMHRQVDVARTYVRAVAARLVAGEHLGDDGSLSGALVAQVCHAKNTAVAACDAVTDAAVQLHGGLGYVRGVEVERHYRDARVLGIGGGATEVLAELAARRLGYVP